MTKNNEIHTKIITTIGPSSNTLEKIIALANSGMTVVRMNFSHGTKKTHQALFEVIKKAEKTINRPISIMLDTKGPEIRVGKMANGGAEILANTFITVYTTSDDYQNMIGNNEGFAVSYEMEKDIKVGDKILFDDGKLVTFVQKIETNKIIVKSENHHFLKTNKRINIPGAVFSLPFLSQKDIDDIKFGISNHIHYIAASFVNSGNDVQEIRKILIDAGANHIKIIPKIESMAGVKNIDEILSLADGIMVARGDLGLEVAFEEIPIIQKMITRKCREVGKPVIIATQMLDSMETSPIPTRAEVTDVYFATSSGADCTMLSGESASGEFPVLAVETMAKINRRAETEFYSDLYYPVMLQKVSELKDNSWRNTIAKNVAQRAKNNGYRFGVILSKSGRSLSKIAKFRPKLILVGILPNPKLIRLFGITSSVFNTLNGAELYEEIRHNHALGFKALLPLNINKGDRYLVVHNDIIDEFTY